MVMDRSTFELVDINHWYKITRDYHFAVADIIVVNTTLAQVDTPYIFKRQPAFCYIESIRDYGMKYCPVVEFLDIINTLQRDFGHLKVNPKDVGKSYERSAQSSTISLGHYGPGCLGEIERPV
jgi:hypothetical protein